MICEVRFIALKCLSAIYARLIIKRRLFLSINGQLAHLNAQQGTYSEEFERRKFERAQAECWVRLIRRSHQTGRIHVVVDSINLEVVPLGCNS